MSNPICSSCGKCFSDCRCLDILPTGTEAKVCADIALRQAKGIGKYGTTVADNPGDFDFWAQNLLEELLDAAIYLKRIQDERQKARSAGAKLDSNYGKSQTAKKKRRVSDKKNRK